MCLRPAVWSLLCLFVPCSAAFRATETTVVSVAPDRDQDGLDDEMEEWLGTDPDDPDTDGDGWDDLAETLAGSDPCDPTDFPRSATSEAAGSLPGDPRLRLKVLELLSHRLAGGAAPGAVPGAADATFTFRYYYPAETPAALAVEVRRSDLKAGSFLLLWRHHATWNPLEVEPRYVVAVRAEDGRTIAEWHTPAPVEEAWRYVGLPFRLRREHEGQVLTLSVTPEADARLDYSLADFVAERAGIETDHDRDGAIGEDERPPDDLPLRHWVNDDADQGEWQEQADVPGRNAPAADHERPGIDGLRDLVDFVPVNLNLGRIARRLRPEDGFRYHLRQGDRAAQAVLTSLPPAGVGALHRDPDLRAFGPDLAGPLASAEVRKPDADGRIELPPEFVRRIAEKGHGVVLLEGTRPSRQPLRLEISRDGRTVADLGQAMELVPVESMYRHVNLAAVARNYSGRPATIRTTARDTQVADPAGLPDAPTRDRWIVLIHGYNVPGASAAGWHAETFKRLHAMGSQARFVGVTWNGDTGLDYHEAVFHAFQTGDALPRALGFLDPSRTTLIAHSLGNVVACQGVQAGFTPARYFLLNAALPIEALDGAATPAGQAAQMTEEGWRQYPRRVYAADWAKLCRPGDPRAGFAWADAFARVRRLGIGINCYSAGEDVTNCPPEMTSASVLATLWSDRAIDYGAWKTQELLKGVGWTRSLAALAMGRTQGGWGFNPAWRGRYVPRAHGRPQGGYYERLDPATAARLPAEQMLRTPFFRPFEEARLHDLSPAPVSPLLDPARIRYDLLARAIPAMTYAAGSNPMPSSGSGRSFANFDLEAQGRRKEVRWPVEGHARPRARGRWLHSDFKNVALPFVFPLYAEIVAAANR